MKGKCKWGEDKQASLNSFLTPTTFIKNQLGNNITYHYISQQSEWVIDYCKNKNVENFPYTANGDIKYIPDRRILELLNGGIKMNYQRKYRLAVLSSLPITCTKNKS